jgi:hypothetical protein
MVNPFCEWRKGRSMLTRPKLVVLFLFGGLAASIGDWFHLQTKTTFYAPESLIWTVHGLPIYIPVFFGIAAALLGIAYDRGKALLGAGWLREGASTAHAVLAGAIYLAVHISSGYVSFLQCPWPHILLGLPVVSSWRFLDGRPGGALFCLLAGLAGTGAEGLLVHFGVFSFSARIGQVLGVATWLPWIYMAAALAVGRLVERR